MKTFRSYSSAETAEFAVELAREIMPNKSGATVLALQGDLGAGKTTFTQGFARGLGIKRRTASPTFIIMRRFAIPVPRGKNSAHSKAAGATFKNFYHVDAYRLKQIDSLEVLGVEEILNDPQNIMVIEWPEKIKKILPRRAIWLKFRYGKKESERIIRIADSR